MARPVRELWKTLGAAAGDAPDLLVVDAAALSLESVFGGPLGGQAAVRLFSEEAFSFSAPDELAALGVFWAPHLERPDQLRAAVRDAQDRLQRRLDDDGRSLERVGFRSELKAPHARCRAKADIGGHQVTVGVGPDGALLLEVVDGGGVPEADREILRTLDGASRQEVEDGIAARAHELLEDGRVVAMEAGSDGEAQLDGGLDDAGFEDDAATRQLPAAARRDLEPGTELVPPPSEEAGLSEAERGDLRAVLDDDEDLLADSLEGRPVEDPEDDRDLEEDFERPVTASERRDHTVAPDSFMELPAALTDHLSMAPAEDDAGDDLPADPDEDTGEQQHLVSLSGEDGVMPSPAEATALRPAPSSRELGLEPGGSQDSDALGRSSRRRSADAEDDDEDTVARAPVFRAGKRGPSLVSSGSQGRSADDALQDREDLDDELSDDLDAVAARALALDVEGTRPTLTDDVEPVRHAEGEDDDPDEDDASTLRPGQLSRGALAAAADEAPIDDLGLPEEATLQGAELSSRQLLEEAPSIDVLEALEAEPTDPKHGAVGADGRRLALEDERSSSLDLDVEVASEHPFDALAEIVGEGISSGKTGAIVLDADAFAQLRGVTNDLPLGDDPEALEREAELLESRARELRGKAALLRERSTIPVNRRHLADRLERERASRDDEALLSAASVSGESAFASGPSSVASAAAGDKPTMHRDDDDALPGRGTAAPSAVADAGDADAFADGVALDEVRAMLESERAAAPELYAATQLAEMDLGELREPSHSGGDVFGGGGGKEPYDTDDHTGRASAYRSSVDSLPQVASADVHALGSMAELDEEKELSAERPAPARVIALVVSDSRARERLKKHLEDTFPGVVELASAADAATLSAREVKAVVIVRPVHDDATVSGLRALEEREGRPPVLVLSSDSVFDGLPGVDLRMTLGRRASEVARQVLEGLETLGVEDSV